VFEWIILRWKSRKIGNNQKVAEKELTLDYLWFRW
jgi:hypothetical protein